MWRKRGGRHRSEPNWGLSLNPAVLEAALWSPDVPVPRKLCSKGDKELVSGRAGIQRQ
jgi:hypothetical protein